MAREAEDLLDYGLHPLPSGADSRGELEVRLGAHVVYGGSLSPGLPKVNVGVGDYSAGYTRRSAATTQVTWYPAVVPILWKKYVNLRMHSMEQLIKDAPGVLENVNRHKVLLVEYLMTAPPSGIIRRPLYIAAGRALAILNRSKK